MHMDKNSLIENIEQIVLYQVAQKVIDTLPEEDRRKVLEASLVKTLDDVLKPWDAKRAIEDDVNKYMIEYLKRPDSSPRKNKESNRRDSR